MWQLEQAPAAPVWFQLAGNHEEDLWQLSQDLVALFPALWVLGLFIDSLPLWQVVHCPGTAEAWL